MPVKKKTSAKEVDSAFLNKLGLTITDCMSAKKSQNIDSANQSNLMMSAMITQRLQMILDVLHYTGKGEQSGNKEVKPQGVLGIMEKIEKNQSESVRLLSNIESIIGLRRNSVVEDVEEGEDYFSKLLVRD